MKELTATILLVFGLCLTANADIWKWVDEHGNVHYGDTPARADAVNAERISYTPANRSASTSSDGRKITGRGNDADPDGASEERRARESAEAYYCEQARDIYRSYVSAPRLYRTREDGQREYLSAEEKAARIAEAEASVSEWCN